MLLGGQWLLMFEQWWCAWQSLAASCSSAASAAAALASLAADVFITIDDITSRHNGSEDITQLQWITMPYRWRHHQLRHLFPGLTDINYCLDWAVCVCVCVCVRERERETDRQTETDRERVCVSLQCVHVCMVCSPLTCIHACTCMRTQAYACTQAYIQCSCSRQNLTMFIAMVNKSQPKIMNLHGQPWIIILVRRFWSCFVKLHHGFWPWQFMDDHGSSQSTMIDPWWISSEDYRNLAVIHAAPLHTCLLKKGGALIGKGVRNGHSCISAPTYLMI